MTSLVEAGSRVGRYILTRRLGIGGFAEVWEAEDQELRRKVAIKLALPALCEEPEFIERFLREARRAANLDHPNILAVYDFGMHEGRPFLVMPVVPGGSLASRMTPPPPVKDALRWLGELAAALDHAHEEGVIHRDVKPPNALFDRKGRLLLSDFGIAKSLEESTVLTQTGAAIGTPAFMAPEQALAQPDRVPIGPAADQYALGILAYRMLTGRFPFEGPTFALLRKTIEEPPPPPSTYRSELSAEVDAVFARVLAKVAGDRYESCEAFVTSLANVLAADAAPPRAYLAGSQSTGATVTASRKFRTARLSVVLGAVAGLAIVGVLIGVGLTRSRSSTPRLNAEMGVSWVPIPSGSFTMGCTQGDPECEGDEKPAHAVRITRPFQMAATLTTNVQYRECVDAGACTPPHDRSAFDDGAKPDHPVVAVDWNQARAFCTWAGGRLPTEAEWEYAARGGTDGERYPWGNEISYDDANFSGTGGKDVWDGTSPVKSFGPNGFGLFDMAGNASEWCEGWYEAGYYAESPSEDPAGPSSGTARVLRGGSWNRVPRYLRVSVRNYYGPGGRNDDTGFRCARDARNP